MGDSGEMFEYTVEGFEKAREFLESKGKIVTAWESGYEVVARANRELEKYIERLNNTKEYDCLDALAYELNKIRNDST